ncbi:MAG: hypothetical protein CVV44_09220 [Spirochaetae bacterium HGW-Spirochaetae-1]|jgi:electron transfer flavoprotein beta subunit|nr:MAG: hypothetical protein CVV44_09220 [Spirochaetae bacterium HGW-Spirochaetae-1]
MKILVCIKQVRDDTSPIMIGSEGKDYLDDGNTVFRMNRLDEYALEEAILIREKNKGIVVDAVSVGPDRARAVVRKALEKGADNGFHIVTGEAAYAPPLVTAALLASFARSGDYDLILTGVMSEDDMNGQTGSMLAGFLGLPCAVSVIEEEINGNAFIDVTSELEGGMREQAVISMPCVLTIQSGINRPRYPSLSNVLRAKTQEIITRDGTEQAEQDGGMAQVTLSYPVKTGRGIILDGTPEEKAIQLLDILHEKALV